MQTNEQHLKFKENILSAAKRRIAFLLFFNYFLFYTIFAVLIYDGFIITKNYLPGLYQFGYIILLILVPICAIFKTYIEMPNENYIFANIDHKIQSRGTFSLFNEILQVNPQHTILDTLFHKNQHYILSLSMSRVFPFRSRYHNYLAAAISFTILLWVALPQNDKYSTNKKITPINENLSDFSLESNNETVKNFMNSKNESLNNPANQEQSLNEKNITKNNINETNNSITKTNTQAAETNTIDKANPTAKAQDDTTISEAKKSSSSGAGSEEAKSIETTEIKNITTEGTKTSKVSLLETQIQDGTSTRSSDAATNNKIIASENATLSNSVGINQNTQYKEFVSLKYQKIIERYFSDSE